MRLNQDEADLKAEMLSTTSAQELGANYMRRRESLAYEAGMNEGSRSWAALCVFDRN